MLGDTVLNHSGFKKRSTYVGMKIPKEQHCHGHFKCNTASQINQEEKKKNG